MAWLIVFLLVMLAGAVFTLVTWPEGQSTASAWFWLRLLVFPALAGGLLYGLRLHYYQDETARLEAQAEVLEEDRQAAILFAREPLAVLDLVYLSPLGNLGAAQHVAEKTRPRRSRDSPRGDAPSSHTGLLLPAQPSCLNHYRSCFSVLLERLDALLHSLPYQIPFEVYLQLPETLPGDEIRAAWLRCWGAFNHRPVEPTLLTRQEGVMRLDAWLDIYGGPALEKFALFVAVQHCDALSGGSAEAAVAILVGWAPLAARKGLSAVAKLSRPVQAEPEQVNAAVSKALLWGAVEPADLSDIWQSGLERPDAPALSRACSDLGVSISKGDELVGIHDLDFAMGDAGAAAPWLVLALAAEHAKKTGKPQLTVSRQQRLQLAVVKPASETHQAGQQG